MDTQVSGVNTWLQLNKQPVCFDENKENWDAQAKEYTRNTFLCTLCAPDDLHLYIDGEQLETEYYGRWYWYPKSYAGLYILTIKCANNNVHIAHIRVLPSKMSYQRYIYMLDDIRDIAEDLLFSIASPAQERVMLYDQKGKLSTIKEYTQIKSIVYELADVIARIHRDPHSHFQEDLITQQLHDIPHFSSEVFPFHAEVTQLPSTLARTLSISHLPTHWHIYHNVATYDIYENRLLKHFLHIQLIPKIHFVEERALNELQRRRQQLAIKRRKHWRDDETPFIQKLEAIVTDCNFIKQQCMIWSTHSFLQKVQPLSTLSSPSQVLLKHPAYARFYHLYQRFQKGLKLSFNIEQYLTMLSLRKMSELYEIWAVFQITYIALAQLNTYGYRIVSKTLFFQTEKDFLQIDVQKNHSSIILEKGQTRLEIKYEPRYFRFQMHHVSFFSNWYSEYLAPDLSIEIYSNGQPNNIILFDAKYRDENVNGVKRFLEEDVNKMRLYRDKIRAPVPLSDKKGKQAVSSAYILYPGDIFDHDHDEPEIGALPLVPNMDQKQRNEIEAAVREILQFSGLASS
ncbi:DUF2357 domain-containing protein [Ktedonobacteria bacterium brp13]|nr:DUF2357 domain-containing protein [Ktedonobacteria bacterium brp13]